MKLPDFLLPRLLRLHAHLHGEPCLASLPEMPQPPACGGCFFCRRLKRRIEVHVQAASQGEQRCLPHDPSTWTVSVVLQGSYWEVLEPNLTCEHYPETYLRYLAWLPFERPDLLHELVRPFNICWRKPGDVVLRRASAARRLVLPAGSCIKSLLVTGRGSRRWGFQTYDGRLSCTTYVGWHNGRGLSHLFTASADASSPSPAQAAAAPRFPPRGTAAPRGDGCRSRR